MALIKFLLASHFATLLAMAADKPDPAPQVPAPGLAPTEVIRLSDSGFFSKYALVVDKSRRTLTVWGQDKGDITFVKAVPADLGRANGDKLASGDHRTPEGIYFPQEIKSESELDFDQYGVRAFPLDYPNFFDVLDQKSGSGIWLHAIPDNKSLWRGSRGCVVVRNETIMELSQFITLKRTPVIIQDSVDFAPATKIRTNRTTWMAWLDSWRNSWQSKNLDTYMNHYSSEFHGLGMNAGQWRKYKEGLNEKYKYIKVNLKDPIVLAHKDRMVFRFIQQYESDQNADFGEKVLYLKRDGSDFKIIGEEWQAVQRDSFVANH